MTGVVEWAGRTVVVTGGLGFIGSHFVAELAARGAEVICLHRSRNEEMIRALPADGHMRLVQLDLSDTAELSALFRRATARIDAVSTVPRWTVAPSSRHCTRRRSSRRTPE